MIDLSSDTNKAIATAIINKWEFAEGRSLPYTLEKITSLIQSETAAYHAFFTALQSYGLIKSNILGEIEPTERFLIYRQTTDTKASAATKADDSNWISFRNLLSYYIHCVKEADRPQFFLNTQKEGRDYVIPKSLSPSWLQPLGEEPLEHTVSFDASSTPMLASILSNASIDSRIFIGYPVLALYENGALHRVLPLAMVPITHLPAKTLLHTRKLEISVRFDFESAALNQEWIDNEIPADEQKDFNTAIYEQLHANDAFSGMLDLALTLPFIKGFTKNCHLDPMTLEQTIPERFKGRSKVLNTAILFKGASTNYVKSLLRELEYIKKAPSSYLERTALAYIFRESPLHAPTEERRAAVPFIKSNAEQLQATSNALSCPISRLQGPPGTGKTQVALNMITNCIYRGNSVLFTSKNHQAVDAIKSKNVGLLEEDLALVNFCIEEESRNSWFEYNREATWNQLAEILDPCGAERHWLLEDSLYKAEKLEKHKRDKQVAMTHLSQAASEFFKAQRDFHESLVGTRYYAAPEIFEEHIVAQILDACRVLDSSSLKNRLLRTLRKNTIASQLSLFAQSHAGFARFIEKKQYKQLKERLESILKLRALLEEKENLYQKANKALLECPVTAEEEQELADLANTIETVQKSAIAYAWNHHATEAVDDANAKDLLEKANGIFKRNRWTLIDRTLDLSIDECMKALETLHKIQPAWATSLLSLHLASPLLPAVFDLVIIDEASQCDCISVIPALYRAKRVAIIGDPQQFRPIYNLTPRRAAMLIDKVVKKSPSLAKFNYVENSAYSLLDHTKKPDLMLKEHFRCLPQIADFISKNFYDDQLIIRTDATNQEIPSCFATGDTIHWIDTKGSTNNEIDEAIAVLKKIKQTGYTGSIGIISPLANVVSKIREKLQFIHGCEDVLVNTAYGFQGGQRDTIIFVISLTTGLTRGQLWYLTDKENNNLYNVTVSRAKACLVLVGNRDLFKQHTNPILKSLAHYPLPVEETNYRFDSTLEERLFFALKQAGIETYIQWPVGNYRLDMAYINGAQKIDIEVDGYQYHFDAYGNRKSKDIRRDKFMTERGWTVVRFTGAMVTNQLALCVEKVKELISSHNE